MTDNQTQNVDEFGNLYNENMGSPNDTIGQDEQVNMQEEVKHDTDWEDQAKYFQSEKDKLHAENQKLKQYEEVGKFLESRPDIVESIKTQAGGQPDTQQAPIKKPAEFDPWEAYNDPASESYKYRIAEMQHAIDNSVGQATQGLKQQTGRAALQSQLTGQGMTNEDISSFMDFADKHPSEYGLDNVIKMWKAVSGAPAQSHNENPLDQVRENQNQPQPTGVLQGERPKAPKSDDDAMWDSIMNAGSRANVL